MKCWALTGLALAAAVAGGAALAAQSQTPRPTFRTGTTAVVIDARVVDISGKFVSDLTLKDFKVFEDGVEQTLTTFALVDLPVEVVTQDRSVSHVGPPSDVTSNSDADGRLYVIVLDDYNPLHPFQDLDSFLEPARELIYHMTPNDRAAIVTTAGRRDMAQEFTNDRSRLLATLGGFTGGNRSQTDVPVSIFLGPGPNPFDPVQDVLRSLTDICNWLSAVPSRRKSIVFVGGIMSRIRVSVMLTNSSPPKGLQNVSLAKDVRTLVAAASRANVSIYTLYPTSLRMLAYDPGEFVLSRIDPDPWTPLSLAQATGGFGSGGNFDGVYERIASESGSYYLLGYTSTSPEENDKFHQVEVKTTRYGLGVRTRAGYYTTRAKPMKPSMVPEGVPMPLVTAMQSPAPVSGIPMSMSIAPFRGEGSKARVSIVLDVDRPDGSAAERPAGKPIEIVMAAATVNTKVADMRRIAVSGGTVIANLDLKPGRYHVRVGALDTADNRRGSVLYDVDVPDFSKREISMSGLTLSSSSPRPGVISATDERWKQTLGTPPTTARTFASTDQLTGYAEVYDNRKSTGPIDFITTVQMDDGDAVFSGPKIVFTEPKTLSVPAVKGTAPLHAIKTMIPLDGMAAGRYVLRMEARGEEGTPPLSRVIPFSVK